MQEIIIKLPDGLIERVGQLKGNTSLVDWIHQAIVEKVQRGYG